MGKAGRVTFHREATPGLEKLQVPALQKSL